MVRFLLTIVVGLFIGVIIGFATPIVMYLYHQISNPGFDGGIGTVVAIMWLFTVPGFATLGVIVGTIVGALRD
jgi:hypothetical protein